MLTDTEKIPFEAIAKRKGKDITFLTSDDDKTVGKTEWPENVHLDMDMVEASIENAILRVTKQGLDSIRGKLERLLANGTDAEKVEFVLGSGTYYFPEDINRMAQLSRDDTDNKSPSCRKVCNSVCRAVCSCLQGGKQECKEACRDVCELVCP